MPARILVVDDEPDLELLVTQRFRHQIRDGVYEFVFARDGEEALTTVADDQGIDLVLTDINMPRMDGLTLLNRLQEISRQLRVVIVSAYSDMHNIRVAMNRGAFDFVTKPIDFKDLETTINKTLEDLRILQKAYRERSAAERARANLARYFSPHLADYLANSPDEFLLKGERRELTFLFTDLADFTPLVENTRPESVVALMNEYLGGLSSLVFRHGGTVDTVVGDAVHAMFGAPLKQDDHASRALACAREIDAFCVDFARRQRAQGLSLGDTRIGINTGPAVVGNFGGEMYFHYTAHGDAINTAARLENANKLLGTRICISGATVEQIDDFIGRPVGSLLLKGKKQAIEAFEPVAGEPDQLEAREAYLAAFDKMLAGDADAVQAFAAYVSAHGDDPLATFHLKRLLAGERDTRIAID
ncbi:MAG: response regulator [Gammaproteobacteria bacterium]|nr:response regulator [Gammaproteobacteria bacterium]